MNNEELKNMATERLTKMIEENGGYSAISYRLILTEIYGNLFFRCDKGIEKVELGQKIEFGNHQYFPDIFIPTGISKLNIPKNSCVEFKMRLITDTIYRINDIAEKYNEKYPESKIYLLYKDQGDVNLSTIKAVSKNTALEIFQIDDFLSKIEKEARLNKEIELNEKDWKQKRNQIVDYAKSCFIENNCSLFLGAGVSQDAGGLSWNDLLFKIVKHFDKDITKRDFQNILKSCGNSAIVLGRYAVNDKKRKELLINYLKQHVLYHNLHESELVNAICEIVENGTISSIITYNYDDIVESALENRGREVTRIYSKNRAFTKELPVYHVHGLIPQKKDGIESKIVLTEEEYHEMYRDAFHWSNVEQLHALDRNTCFFIGMSMTDPNLRRLLDISKAESDNEPHHFAFLKRESLRKKDVNTELEKRHFDIIQSQYESLNINVIWVEDFAEIPELLRKISAPIQLV